MVTLIAAATAWHACDRRVQASSSQQHVIRCAQVIKGPVTKYFPSGARRIGFSQAAESLQPMHEYVRTLDNSVPHVFVVGAFAHGHIDMSYTDEQLSISQYSLSAAYAIARITNALEMKWGVV